MNTYVRFLYEFLDQLLGGLVEGFKQLFLGILQMFDVRSYARLIKYYSADFSGGEWLLVIIAVIITIILLALIIFLAYFVVRKLIRFRKTLVEQESLLEELADLHKQVAKLMKEKDELYAMKVSQLGLNPDEDPNGGGVGGEAPTAEGEEEGDIDAQNTRFPKLVSIDLQYKDYKAVDYGNSFTLPEIVENFRNFAASELHLYYTSNMMRLFIKYKISNFTRYLRYR